MIRLSLRTQAKGQLLKMEGWACLADSPVSAALERGEQVAGSYLWLSLADIQFFGPTGKRLTPEAGFLAGSRLLLVSGLECTLMPLPEG